MYKTKSGLSSQWSVVSGQWSKTIPTTTTIGAETARGRRRRRAAQTTPAVGGALALTPGVSASKRARIEGYPK
jgi:hypothetical protein